MSNSQAPVTSQPSLFRRKPVWIAGAVMALAILAGCSTGIPSASGPTVNGSSGAGSPTATGGGKGLSAATGISTPQPSSDTGIKVASQVPGAPSQNCGISANMVNSCGPWVGAAAGNNPGAPDNDIQQFLYLEKLLGHHLDIYRDYHNVTNRGALGAPPLDAAEMYFVKQPDTYLDINWSPARNWAEADGGDATVNAQIRQAADSIRSVSPHKIFLTVWVEPQNDVSGGTNCPGLVGHAGTPAQYRQMWANVENIFRSQGTDNVIWTMNYMSYPHFDCLVPQLWPGNSLVDWVLYDSYDHDNSIGTTWGNTVGRFYQTLENDSSPSVDFDSKPWGLGEFNTCYNNSPANTLAYFQQAREAIQDNTYPRLKMFNIFATTGDGSASQGCLTDYAPNGQLDPSKMALIRALFAIPLFNR
jgi:hypothetical protein